MLDCALVLQGGGTRGIYVAGAIDFLMEQGFECSYVIGSSCGAMCGANYVAGNKGRTLQIMTKYMRNPRFVNPLKVVVKGTLFDFEYLWNVIPKKLPFDYDHFFGNPCRFTAVATSFETGQAAYFEKSEANIFDGIAASSSLPDVTPRPPLVDDHPYLDGGVVESIPFRKPIEEGFKKIIIIVSRERGYRKKPMSEKKIAKAKKKYARNPDFLESYLAWNDHYNDDVDQIDKMADEGRAFVLYPSEHLTIGVAEIKKKPILDTYQLGYENMKAAYPDLQAYLAK